MKSPVPDDLYNMVAARSTMQGLRNMNKENPGKKRKEKTQGPEDAHTEKEKMPVLRR